MNESKKIIFINISLNCIIQYYFYSVKSNLKSNHRRNNNKILIILHKRSYNNQFELFLKREIIFTVLNSFKFVKQKFRYRQNNNKIKNKQ